MIGYPLWKSHRRLEPLRACFPHERSARVGPTGAGRQVYTGNEADSSGKAKTLKAWLDMIEAVFNSKTAELQERREQIKSFQKLLGEAQAKGFALFEVPADGNCAVHGLCNLGSGTPGNGSPPAVVAAVREEIAQAWEKATEDSNWTEVFEKLVAVFDPDPEPAKASKAKKEVKMEQTPQRSKRGAVFCWSTRHCQVILRYNTLYKVQNFRRV